MCKPLFIIVTTATKKVRVNVNNIAYYNTGSANDPQNNRVILGSHIWTIGDNNTCHKVFETPPELDALIDDAIKYPVKPEIDS